MAEEYENFEAREAEARRAVERWEAEGGSQEAEQPAEPTREDKPAAEQTTSPDSAGKGRDRRGHSREGSTMNQTTVRRMQLRDLARRVADARSAVARQTTHRESVIGRDGAAHPRSISASRRLNRTQSAYRALAATYRRRRGEDSPDGR